MCEDKRLQEIEEELNALHNSMKALWAERKSIRLAQKNRKRNADRAEREACYRELEAATAHMSREELGEYALGFFPTERGPHDPWFRHYSEGIWRVMDVLPRYWGQSRTEKLLGETAERVLMARPVSPLLPKAVMYMHAGGHLKSAPTIDLRGCSNDEIDIAERAFQGIGYAVRFERETAA